ncbi:MAG: PaaI family thioesterase [Nocardioidaceae bacterium]|nr:PaaI family thioesterase [Nocardioidaceae bacterium]
MGTSPPDTGLVALLGLRFEHISADQVVISWTVDERHLQPQGIVHGGVYCAVNETAASVAGSVWFGGRGRVVGVANTTDFIRQAEPGATLTATASPVHRGRLQQLWSIETYDAADRMVARGQVRLQNLPVE